MWRFAIMVGALLLPAPLMAEVRESSASGFLIQLGVDVPAGQEAVWDSLVRPSTWWSAEHSYSNDAANFSLDPRAGGCFCEVLPSKTSPKAAPRGSVEHMRVVYVEQPRALRMVGALGPLQAGAGTGTLTVVLRPQGEGTRVLWEYAYGGYVRGDVPALAKTVDGVLAGQLLRLGRLLGARGGAPLPVEPVPAPGPQAVKPTTQSDFLQEMQAGIGEASAGSPEAPQPGAGVPEKTVNDQGFVGR